MGDHGELFKDYGPEKPRRVTRGWMIATGVAVLFIIISVTNDDTDTGRSRTPTGPVISQQTKAMPDLVAQSEEICRLFSSPGKRREMAAELGAASTSDNDLAAAYGRGFDPRWRTHATRYCLEGLSSP